MPDLSRLSLQALAASIESFRQDPAFRLKNLDLCRQVQLVG
jgi:hypothetical protein